ncbi:hypothetical protein HOG16_05065 [Candidatus Woesearchaeota archaeon]|jgi:hypothetical protein|nr:hypothetical protein [archaeon]MBT3691580.1 hypothetical protein [Candidatus Woesearchaeota archaeon]MBT4373528.1 hypothetical protein [archaeon]MBT4531976.1 hypothetical protein [archaeon]MBT7001643.1 hypothetical protein [archaeon]
MGRSSGGQREMGKKQEKLILSLMISLINKLDILIVMIHGGRMSLKSLQGLLVLECIL